MVGDIHDDTLYWFAMSAPYRKEMEAKQLMDSKGVENFLPLQNKIFTNSRGIKVRKLVPVISNLFFVHSTRREIQDIKSRVPFLQYRTRPVNGRNVPIIVPDRQMQQFITVCETRNEKLIYLSPQEIDIAKGTPVRVIKVRGARAKRVVVQIDGVAVATAEIEPQFIEVIDKD